MKKVVMIFYLLLLFSIGANGQPLAPYEPVPVDGGVIGLFIMGAAYGYIKKRKKH